MKKIIVLLFAALFLPMFAHAEGGDLGGGGGGPKKCQEEQIKVIKA